MCISTKALNFGKISNKYAYELGYLRTTDTSDNSSRSASTDIIINHNISRACLLWFEDKCVEKSFEKLHKRCRHMCQSIHELLS